MYIVYVSSLYIYRYIIYISIYLYRDIYIYISLYIYIVYISSLIIVYV